MNKGAWMNKYSIYQLVLEDLLSICHALNNACIYDMQVRTASHHVATKGTVVSGVALNNQRKERIIFEGITQKGDYQYSFDYNFPYKLARFPKIRVLTKQIVIFSRVGITF